MFKQNKQKYLSKFYLCICFLWFSTEVFLNSTLQGIAGISIDRLNFLQQVTIVLLLLIQIFILQSYTRKEFLIMMAVMVLVAISTVISRNRVIMAACLMIVGAKESNFDEIVKVTLWALVISVPAVFLLRFFGVLADHTLYRAETVRLSLGFSHPNQLGMRIFQIIACCCYLRRNQMNMLDILLIGLGAVFCYYIPNSQAAVVCLLLLYVLFFLHRRCKKRYLEDIFLSVLVIGAGFLNVASIILSRIDVLQSPFLARMDKLISRRFSEGHVVWEIYGSSFFGREIILNDASRAANGLQQRIYLDNTYLYLLLRYGIIVYVLFSLVYLYAMYYYRKKGEGFMVIFFFIYAVYGLIEYNLCAVTLNMFLLAIPAALWHGEGYCCIEEQADYGGSGKPESWNEGRSHPVVSVVIPIFQIETSVLETCVRSVMAQSIENIEIILINDGSTEENEIYCRAFEKEDSRIHLISHENRGVSVCRNEGMQTAQGDWVAFVDGDDWLEPVYLEKLLQTGKNSGADIVLCDCFVDYPKKERIKHFFRENHLDSVQTGKERFFMQFLCPKYYHDNWGQADSGAPWGKIYRRAFLERSGIQFDPRLRRMQDNVFNLYAYERAARIVYTALPLYHYRKSKSSGGSRYIPQIGEYYRLVFAEMACFFRNVGKDIYWKAFYVKVCTSFYILLRNNFMHRDNPYTYLRRRMAAREMLEDKWYDTAVKNVDLSLLSPLEKLFVAAMRLKAVDLLFIMYWCKDCLWRLTGKGSR